MYLHELTEVAAVLIRGLWAIDLLYAFDLSHEIPGGNMTSV
jgi:hypothetical protein